MKITDGKRTVEIRLIIWQGTGYSPDWSNDFFDAGMLSSIEVGSDLLYCVPDVEYCIDQAQEWQREDKDNAVIVTDL